MVDGQRVDALSHLRDGIVLRLSHKQQVALLNLAGTESKRTSDQTSKRADKQASNQTNHTKKRFKANNKPTKAT